MSNNEKKLVLELEEIRCLRKALKNGGKFIKIPNELPGLAEVIKADENGCFVTLVTLTNGFTTKLQEYYHDSVPEGYHFIPLARFINKKIRD